MRMTDLRKLEQQIIDQLEQIDWLKEAGKGARLASLVERLETVNATAERISQDFDRIVRGGGPSVPDASSPPAISAATGRQASMLDFLLDILREAGEPVHYEELTRRMLDRGYVTKGKTPDRSVNAVLNRAGDLVAAVGDGFYTLRTPLAGAVSAQ